MCAAKHRLSDRDHTENGGVGAPKLPGKVCGDILVDVRVRNTNLHSPGRRSRAKRWCIVAGLLSAMVVFMLPEHAEGLACMLPKTAYFLDCDGAQCLPMFRTDFSAGYGRPRWVVLESIELWEVDALSAEIRRRLPEPDGVVQVWIRAWRLSLPEHELEHVAQLEWASIEPLVKSAEAVRREWEEVARRQLRASVISRIRVWAAFLVLVLVCGLAARSVWRNATGQAGGRKSTVCLAVGLQALVAAIGVCVVFVFDPSGTDDGLWPIALAGAIALSLVVAELAALGVKRVRNRTSE